MKKTCGGCRAYISGCWLGKKIKLMDKNIIGVMTTTQIPDEDYPKPKTKKDLIFYLQAK